MRADTDRADIGLVEIEKILDKKGFRDDSEVRPLLHQILDNCDDLTDKQPGLRCRLGLAIADAVDAIVATR